MAQRLSRLAARLARHQASSTYLHGAVVGRGSACAVEWDLLSLLESGQHCRLFYTSTHLLESLNVQVPSMGDSILEGTIAAVLKQQGEAVEEDEAIMQIETDKVTIDVRAPKAGKVEAVLVSAEDIVTPGQHVATVAAGEEGASGAAAGGESEGGSQPREEMDAQQSAQLQEGMSQPGSSKPGPQGGGVKQQQRQESAEVGQASSAQADAEAGPSHRQPSIRFPIRRTSDGRRLSDMPFEEAEQYRQQAQGASAPAAPQPPAAPPSAPKPAAQSADDAAAAERHMLWYRGREQGTKLSQSSVLSDREMDLIELGGAM